jgi:hypothetical protein
MSYQYLILRGIGRFRKLSEWVLFFINIPFLIKKLFGLSKNINLASSEFDVDIKKLESELKIHGIALGIDLKKDTIKQILDFSKAQKCYADRNPKLGFYYSNLEDAQAKIGKSILVAQYYNAMECPSISRLAHDPLILEIARKYLGDSFRLLGVNLWWTFASGATEEDRLKHAHYFHRDVDDLKFIKFFFYINDVDITSAHVYVKDSIKMAKKMSLKDVIFIRRYKDMEIENYYGKDSIVSVTGPAGTGFVEDTFLFHKGTTPTVNNRLLLQFQFGIFPNQAHSDILDKFTLSNIS